MSAYAEPMRAEWADAVARNVAAAPAPSAALLDKLAVILGPAAERARRDRRPVGKPDLARRTRA
jgi:hypothetical protein